MTVKCDKCGQAVPVTLGPDGITGKLDEHPGGAGVVRCDGSGAPWKKAEPMRTDAKRVRRFDVFTIDALKPPERRANGWLSVEGRISRVGVQQYEEPGGRIRRELRRPSEVFKADSMASFALVPVTNRHPPVLLDAKSAKQYSVGAVGQNIRRDGDWLVAPMMIHDAEAIADVEGGRSELSCGYTCELKEDAGVWRGEDGKGEPQPYDVEQISIVGNHLATVDIARAGPGASMRLDEGDARMLASPSAPKPSRTEKPMPQVVKIDGLTLEVTDGNSQAIQTAIEKAIAGAFTKGAEGIAPEKARADAAEKAKTEAVTAVSKLQAILDAARARRDAKKKEMEKCDECGGSGKVDGEKCDGCDGKGEVPAYDDGDDDGDADDEPKAKEKKAKKDKKRADSFQRRLQRGVRERVALEVEARKFLGADAKLEKLDALGIKKLVVTTLLPEQKLDGESDAYVEASYKIATKQHADAGGESAADRARRAAAAAAGGGGNSGGGGNGRGDGADPETAYTSRMRDAWKPKK